MKIILLLLIVCSCFGCTKEGPTGPSGKDGAQDMQIRFRFEAPSQISSQSGMTYLAVIKFNKAHYKDVDSIVLVANPSVATQDTSNNNCLIDIVNLTDNTPIESSLIKTNRPYDLTNSPADYTYLQSGNIFKELPDKEINLGIRTRSEINGKTVFHYNYCYLFLYRR